MIAAAALGPSVDRFKRLKKAERGLSHQRIEQCLDATFVVPQSIDRREEAPDTSRAFLARLAELLDDQPGRPVTKGREPARITAFDYLNRGSSWIRRTLSWTPSMFSERNTWQTGSVKPSRLGYIASSSR